jgi:hypothetical protein
MFWSLFILRRASLSLICVFFKDYQAIQIQLLIMQSVAMFYYLAKYQPFESIVENFLLVFNESIIITAVYHMMVFSDAFNGE